VNCLADDSDLLPLQRVDVYADVSLAHSASIFKV
jgi:hypothetical protein